MILHSQPANQRNIFLYSETTTELKPREKGKEGRCIYHNTIFIDVIEEIEEKKTYQ